MDDMQFWEELAQHGTPPQWLPRTDEQAAAKAEARASDEKFWSDLNESLGLDESKTREKQAIDYVFNERNPLKELFDDPFGEGLKRLELGDIPSAALLFEAAVEKEPENALAWQYLGTTQAQNENDRLAIIALELCLERQPANQEARMALAVSLVNETKYNEACGHLVEWLAAHQHYGPKLGIDVAQFRSSLKAQQESNEHLFGGTSDLREKNYKFVKEKFVEALRMAAGPVGSEHEIQAALGVICNMCGDYQEAADYFRGALAVSSDDSLLWNRLGATLANGNKTDEAVAAYRRSLEISPGFLRSRYNLAISLVQMNLYEEAAHQLLHILNTQSAGNRGHYSGRVQTRAITSSSIWNTLRTVATLMNRPDLYGAIDGRDLDQCNSALFELTSPSGSANSGGASTQGA